MDIKSVAMEIQQWVLFCIVELRITIKNIKCSQTYTHNTWYFCPILTNFNFLDRF